MKEWALESRRLMPLNKILTLSQSKSSLILLLGEQLNLLSKEIWRSVHQANPSFNSLRNSFHPKLERLQYQVQRWDTTTT